MIDTNDFFLQGRGSGARAIERGARSGSRENAGGQKGSRIRVNHARRDGVAGERGSLDDAGRRNATGAVLEEHSGRYRGERRNGDRGGTKVTAVGAGKRNGLAVGDAALDQPAPFHVVEEEGALAIAVVQLSESDWTADVETEYVQPEFR